MESILAQALGQEVGQLAASEKQHLLSRLLARLAHEIRNPLSSLDIHVQLLEEDIEQLAPESRNKLLDRLEIVHGEIHRLEIIVKQFLRLAGPSELALEPVATEKLVGHVFALLRPEAADRGIELRLSIQNPLPPFQADLSQLTQAMLNLVINSLQAVERNGWIEIAVSANDSCMSFEIADSGPGVPLEKASAIFEPFYTTRAEGTGLGLWIVQQIVGAHQGSVQVANRPGAGAVFSLQIPLSPSRSRGEK